jgi:hypothetical protein
LKKQNKSESEQNEQAQEQYGNYKQKMPNINQYKSPKMPSIKMPKI